MARVSSAGACGLAVVVLVTALFPACARAPHKSPPGSNQSNQPTSSTQAGAVTSLAIDSIHMVTTAEGWAIAGSRLLHTTDGGGQWADVTPAGAPLTTGDTLGGGLTDPSAGALALNSDDAWVMSSDSKRQHLLYRTTDGGASWTSAILPGTGYYVGPFFDFVNPLVGWMLVVSGVAAGSEGVALYRTDNGGSTWAQINASDPSGQTRGAMPFAGDKTGIGMAPAGGCSQTAPCPSVNGLLAGVSGVHDASAVLNITNDGGITWSPQFSALPPPYTSGIFITYPPYFFSATQGLLAANIVASRATLLLFHTNDAGKHWNAFAPTVAAGTAGNEFTVAFLNQLMGWVALQIPGSTPEVYLYRTVNGGNTWSAMSPDQTILRAVTGGALITGLDFVSNTTGWMTVKVDSRGELLMTNNAGLSWRVVSSA